MLYYFYKITNNLNNKYYYGVHKTSNINDGYMGSGVYLRRAYNKYGIENFTKSILKYFSNSDDMYKYESEIVTEDLVRDPMCYNVNIGGKGGSVKGECNPLYGTKFTKDHCNKIANSLKGKSKSEEHKQKLRRPKSEEHKQKLRRPKSDIAKQHISEGTKKAMKQYYLTHERNPEQYKKSWETRRKNGTIHTSNGHKQSEHFINTMRNLKWMCNSNEIIRVKSEDVEKYKEMGYKLGRKKS